jgi:peptidyl-prolyl cis-trans isomerase A (cyclophilin A)/peptidyl-prolyl cis-trans isomerase B (cyclophilin B)
MKAMAFAAALAVLIGSAAMAADPNRPEVIIHTSLGDITLILDRTKAPVTVANFLRYAQEGHYDGTVFYRVVPGFVIQAGSYDADVHARPVHDPIALEANNGLANTRGAIAMARQDDPNSATAEFFIDLSDNPALDHHPDDSANQTGYAVFGTVVSGMDVVDKIAAVPLGDHGPMPGAAPVEPVVIQKIEIAP